MYFSFLILIVVIYANFVGRQFIFDPAYCLYPDSLNLYFYNSVSAANLYAKDVFLAYALQARQQNPIASYSLVVDLYAFLAKYLNMVLILKSVSVAASLGCCALVHRIGLVIYKRPQAAKLLCAVFCVYFLSMDSLYHGQPRTFGILIFCLFMYSLFTKRFCALPVFIILAWAFYPPILPLICASCVLVFFAYGPNWAPGLKRAYVALFGAFALLAAAVVLGTYNGMDISSYQMYKFSGFLGHAAVLPDPIRFTAYFILNLNEHSELYRYFTIFFLLLAGIFLLRGKLSLLKNMPGEIKTVLVGSAAAFILVAGFSLPTAARQFVFTIPFALTFVIVGYMLRWTDSRLKTASYIVLTAFVLLHPLYNDIKSFSKYKLVYEYLNRQDPQALIAGHPDSELIYSIPFFAKRPVVSFKDMAQFPFNQRAMLDIRRRYENSLAFFYADSAAGAEKFIAEYKPDLIIIENSFYFGDTARSYTERGGTLPVPGKRFWPAYALTHCDFSIRTDDDEICVIKTNLSVPDAARARSAIARQAQVP
ncbi:MAG: hypothetical protein WCK75_06630 [Elusimicrobiota bacterium]